MRIMRKVRKLLSLAVCAVMLTAMLPAVGLASEPDGYVIFDASTSVSSGGNFVWNSYSGGGQRVYSPGDADADLVQDNGGWVMQITNNLGIQQPAGRIYGISAPAGYPYLVMTFKGNQFFLGLSTDASGNMPASQFATIARLPIVAQSDLGDGWKTVAWDLGSATIGTELGLTAYFDGSFSFREIYLTDAIPELTPPEEFVLFDAAQAAGTQGRLLYDDKEYTAPIAIERMLAGGLLTISRSGLAGEQNTGSITTVEASDYESNFTIPNDYKYFSVDTSGDNTPNFLSFNFPGVANGHIPELGASSGHDFFEDAIQTFTVDLGEGIPKGSSTRLRLSTSRNGSFGIKKIYLTNTPKGGTLPGQTPEPSRNPEITPYPTVRPCTGDCCIDYSGTLPESEIIVPADTAGFDINLTREVITVPQDYTISSYSLDGTKWKAANAKTFTPVKFPKLLKKGMTLHIANDAVDKATKRPKEGSQIVKFAKINPPPAAFKLMANYSICQDQTGRTPGMLVFIEKNGTKPFKESASGEILEVGVGDPAYGGKIVNERGFGKFYPGDDRGICIKPLGEKNGKPAVIKTIYLYRVGPKGADESGAYTPGSVLKKIRATSERKPPIISIKVPKKQGSSESAVLKVKKGMYVRAVFVGEEDDGATIRQPKDFKYEINVIASISGPIETWMGATPKKAVSAKRWIGSYAK
ncbi:MAG: hypothetical protein FWH04_03740 [Oscillospiraceae bacterium]|nr:hypothetical protein [Oscillospiraceae bacterium]